MGIMGIMVITGITVNAATATKVKIKIHVNHHLALANINNIKKKVPKAMSIPSLWHFLFIVIL